MLQYQARGYDDEWIKIRVNNIMGRKDLENEWSNRGVRQGVEFALLTDAMSMEAFGVKTSEHKNLKQLGQSHSLRDNMTSLELLFTSLAEQSTAKIARKQDSQGFEENEHAAKAGGKIAGDARRNLEIELGEGVVTTENYLTQKQKQNQQKRLPEAQKQFERIVRLSSKTIRDNG